MSEAFPQHRRMSQGTFVIRLFLLAVAVGCGGGLLAWLLIRFGPRPPATAGSGLQVPPAFLLSTLILAAISVTLHRARAFVRRERQRPFRGHLLIALGLGTMFVGVQTFGLWGLTGRPQLEQTSTGAVAFAFVFAALHALHVAVALMFLVFVTLRGLTDRYDHEYYWGVTVCALFWDILAIVWLAILFVFLIAGSAVV